MSANQVTIYTTQWCPYCVRAKALLNQKGVCYTEISVDGDSKLREQMAERAGSASVPQIWVGDIHIGGCDDMLALDREGRLDSLIAGEY